MGASHSKAARSKPSRCSTPWQEACHRPSESPSFADCGQGAGCAQGSEWPTSRREACCEPKKWRLLAARCQHPPTLLREGSLCG